MLPQHDQYASHPHMPLHMADLGSQSTLPSGSVGAPLSLPQQSHYASSNLGSAVSSSMHLTNSSHDSDVGAASAYKMESDMMYYSVSSKSKYWVFGKKKIFYFNLIIMVFTEHFIWVESYNRRIH